MENKIQKIFGQTVRRLRKEQGFSQENFAEKAQIHRTYVSGIESGMRNPTLTSIVKIAEALSVEPEKIFTEMKKNHES